MEKALFHTPSAAVEGESNALTEVAPAPTPALLRGSSFVEGQAWAQPVA
jgi:hypothetical protein